MARVFFDKDDKILKFTVDVTDFEDISSLKFSGFIFKNDITISDINGIVKKNEIEEQCKEIIEKYKKSEQKSISNEDKNKIKIIVQDEINRIQNKENSIFDNVFKNEIDIETLKSKIKLGWKPHDDGGKKRKENFYEILKSELEENNILDYVSLKTDDKNDENNVYEEVLKDIVGSLIGDLIEDINNQLAGQKAINEADSRIFLGCGLERVDKKPIFTKSEMGKITLNGYIGAVQKFVDKEKFKTITGYVLGSNKNNVSIQLRIHSKFDEEGDDKTNYFFSATMLTHGLVSGLSSDSVDCDENMLFDFLLIDFFVRYLQEACKKGAYRTYRQFEKNDDKLRGAIDVSRHIRLNMGQDTGRIAYRYRENTVNNYLNILIVKTYEYIKKRYREIVERKIDGNHDIHSFMMMLMYDTDAMSISQNQVIRENLRPISHPYFAEYEEVRKVCLKILRGEGVSIFGDSDNNTVGGFLYYMPDLWEDYLNDIFREAIDNSINLRKEEQYELGYIQKHKQNNQKYNNKENYLCTARPDFVFSDGNNQPVMILDAKCKHWMWEVANQDKYDERFVHDVDKCIRDMVILGAKETGVVFPAEDSINVNDTDYHNYYNGKYSEFVDKHERIISNSNKDCKFYFLPHFVPKSRKNCGYGEWKVEFDASREEFIKFVRDKCMSKKEQ